VAAVTVRAPVPVAPPGAPAITPELLVDRVLGGEPGAWARLAESVHAQVLEVCSRRRWAAGSPHAADVHREVALRVLEKLHAGDYGALRAWAAARDRYPEARFAAWLGAVASNALIDQQRASPDFARRRDGAGRRTEAVAHVELEERAADTRDPATAVDLARVVRLLADEDFPADQRSAIALWLRGHDATAIAAELGLAGGAAAADKLLHAARERLRRAMRRPGGSHV
jgi:DNA-directed RNA polymerase specialized sigma24 family protein